MSEQYDFCWHGATWRTVPAPQPMALEIVRLQGERTRRSTAPADCEQRVWEVLTDHWQNWSPLKDRARMSGQTLTRTLRRMVKQGRIEKRLALGPTRYGRYQYFYRRLVQQSEAA